MQSRRLSASSYLSYCLCVSDVEEIMLLDKQIIIGIR